jgi:glutamyl-tRNA reductase
MMVIDIAVPRDAEDSIGDLDGVYLFNIDDLDKVVKANLAERQKAAEHAGKIVEHEAGQFEQWLRTQSVVPTIRALRDHFAQIAELEVQKALDQVARKDHTRDQQRELIQRLVQLVVNKLLHQPTTALRTADADAELRAAVLCEVFGLEPKEGEEPVAEPPRSEQAPAEQEKKAQA